MTEEEEEEEKVKDRMADSNCLTLLWVFTRGANSFRSLRNFR